MQGIVGDRPIDDARLEPKTPEDVRDILADRLARLGALQVAASYVQPGAWPRLEDVEPVTEIWQRPVIRRAMHVVTFEGSEPPDEDTPRRVLERLGAPGPKVGR
ncbi:MAG: hypothetical protein ACOC8B_00180 [Gemmatimonadota bacterium]